MLVFVTSSLMSELRAMHCTGPVVEIIQPYIDTVTSPLKTSSLDFFAVEKGNFIDFFQFPDSQQQRGARNDTKPKTSLIFSQLI